MPFYLTASFWTGYKYDEYHKHPFPLFPRAISVLLIFLTCSRKELSYIMKMTILKCQSYGILYPAVKVVIFLIGIISVLLAEELTIEKTIRVIGWVDQMKILFAFYIPDGLQYFPEMVASTFRIQVLQTCFIYFVSSMWTVKYLFST